MHFSSSLHINKERSNALRAGCLAACVGLGQSHQYMSGMVTSNLHPALSSLTLKEVMGTSRWQSLSLVKVTVTFYTGGAGQDTHSACTCHALHLNMLHYGLTCAATLRRPPRQSQKLSGMLSSFSTK